MSGGHATHHMTHMTENLLFVKKIIKVTKCWSSTFCSYFVELDRAAGKRIRESSFSAERIFIICLK